MPAAAPLLSEKETYLAQLRAEITRRTAVHDPLRDALKWAVRRLQDWPDEEALAVAGGGVIASLRARHVNERAVLESIFKRLLDGIGSYQNLTSFFDAGAGWAPLLADVFGTLREAGCLDSRTVVRIPEANFEGIYASLIDVPDTAVPVPGGEAIQVDARHVHFEYRVTPGFKHLFGQV
jgi:hypothetical protein